MTALDITRSVLPPRTQGALLESDWVTEPTRRALRARLAGPGATGPRCLGGREFAVLASAVARLVPQSGPKRVPLAEAVAEDLASGRRDGWRYDDLPPDQDAYRIGLQGLDETALSLFGLGFVELGPADQDAVLEAVQDGCAPNLIWARMSATRFFEDLLADAVEAYASHPFGQAAMAYRGMADARGFGAIGLDRRDPVDIDGPDAPV